ncbi:hypothetical protein MWN33_10005 [Starkeya koreensis]|uniref:Uncharacterized protein n=1 Tax=Ancylobacter koreensis TaxID=266121 RepID=A0ABT0DM49_9HYPH|nr:hypothetical protein [Ancylobacter koreensis]MCK0208362.1 hypothetical protein [Ancylobacter koreensis]
MSRPDEGRDGSLRENSERENSERAGSARTEACGIGSAATSSEMMRRMEASISSMDGSFALAFADIALIPIIEPTRRRPSSRVARIMR